MGATEAVLEAVRQAHSAGLCVLPPREDGTKRPWSPSDSWKEYQHRRPTQEELDEWYAPAKRHGLGIVPGAISGGVEWIEFDASGEVYHPYKEAAKALGLGDLVARIEAGYLEQSPSGGIHWPYRCAEISGNTKLARRPKRPEERKDPKDEWQVLIETRGEGGYMVVAPSHGHVHSSGKPYVLLSGGFDSIVTITPEERKALFDLARTFDYEPPKEKASKPGPTGGRPGDAFNERANWPDILEPHGWQAVFERGGVIHWRRPGKDFGTSATTNHGGTDRLFVFSSSTAFESERSFSKFGAYAVLNHGGDFRAASRALAVQGYTDMGNAQRLVVAPSAESLAGLLDDAATHIRLYVILSDHQRDALALWVAHTHSLEAADCTPYLSVTSAEKRSGKTRCLETLSQLVRAPWFTDRVSAAVLIRKIARDQPTLLLDESDAAFNGEKEYAEALRGILNAGYRRGGAASLCVRSGKDFGLVDFPVFGAKAIAGIGKLPSTIQDRSISIKLKRRATNEPVKRFRARDAVGEAAPIRERLTRWAAGAVSALKSARPELPEALDDRAADGWEPLLAIADLAGADWPQRARKAGVGLSTNDREDESLGVRLLSDIRNLFITKQADRVSSEDIVNHLVSVEESPWGDIRKGKPLDKANLAARLKPFNVCPKQLRFGTESKKGYERTSFEDAWKRYLPSLPEGETVETGKQREESPVSANGVFRETPSTPETVSEREVSGVSGVSAPGDKEGTVTF